MLYVVDDRFYVIIFLVIRILRFVVNNALNVFGVCCAFV